MIVVFDSGIIYDQCSSCELTDMTYSMKYQWVTYVETLVLEEISKTIKYNLVNH